MRLRRQTSRPLSMLSPLLLLLLGSVAIAQDQTDGDQTTPATSTERTTSGQQTQRPAVTTTTATGQSGTARTSSSGAASTPSSSRPTIDMSNAPSISSSTRTTVAPTGNIIVIDPSALPTLAGAGIPTVIVPDTSQAPFMQKSNLPEGTVFICVGAALGFFGACILAWRALVAWSLHRSVKRAAMAQNLADTKAMLRGPGGGYSYSAAAASSTLSLDHLSTPNNGNKLTKSFMGGTPPPPLPNHRDSTRSSLFFSPTAAPNSLHASGNRSSGYLPAGYYPTGSSAPAPMTHLGVGGGVGSTVASAIPSLLSRGPTAAGYTRAGSLGPSPPVSPSLAPTSHGNIPHGSPYDRQLPSRGADSISGTHPVNRSSSVGLSRDGLQSTSTLSLAAPPQGRTPSAYLEDLFENHGNGPRERY